MSWLAANECSVAETGEKKVHAVTRAERSNFFSLLIPPPTTALLEKFSLAWLAFFLIFPFDVTPIRTLTWDTHLSTLSLRFPFVFIPKLKAVIKAWIPSEVTALNMLKTNKENTASGQLPSPTYHCRISPLARDTSHLVNRNNQLLEKLGITDPWNPQLKAASVLAFVRAHTHTRSTSIASNRILMPFHHLAIMVPAL